MITFIVILECYFISYPIDKVGVRWKLSVFVNNSRIRTPYTPPGRYTI